MWHIVSINHRGWRVRKGARWCVCYDRNWRRCRRMRNKSLNENWVICQYNVIVEIRRKSLWLITEDTCSFIFVLLFAYDVFYIINYKEIDGVFSWYFFSYLFLHRVSCDFYLTFLFYFITDENFRLDSTRNFFNILVFLFLGYVLIQSLPFFLLEVIQWDSVSFYMVSLSYFILNFILWITFFANFEKYRNRDSLPGKPGKKNVGEFLTILSV